MEECYQPVRTAALAVPCLRNQRTFTSEMSARVASGQAEASKGRVRTDPWRSRGSTRLAYNPAVSSGMLPKRLGISCLPAFRTDMRNPFPDAEYSTRYYCSARPPNIYPQTHLGFLPKDIFGHVTFTTAGT
jgi:hypothetical protein